MCPRAGSPLHVAAHDDKRDAANGHVEHGSTTKNSFKGTGSARACSTVSDARPHRYQSCRNHKSCCACAILARDGEGGTAAAAFAATAAIAAAAIAAAAAANANARSCGVCGRLRCQWWHMQSPPRSMRLPTVYDGCCVRPAPLSCVYHAVGISDACRATVSSCSPQRWPSRLVHLDDLYLDDPRYHT